MNINESIEATKISFEKSFAERKLYDRQTQDFDHLSKIIGSLNIKTGSKILDLGTGTGYIAFEIAKRNEIAQVTGLDIVEKTLLNNKKKANNEGILNVNFTAYDGKTFPFDDNSFDIIVTRYALHHFPDISRTFGEISRVLKPSSQFFISDPTPNENDTTRFVDDFMRMKPDGHIKYYTKSEWIELGKAVGFKLTDCFETNITFPRLKEAAAGYNDILQKHSGEIIKGYDVYEADDGKYIYITQRVLNISFLNCKKKSVGGK